MQSNLSLRTVAILLSVNLLGACQGDQAARTEELLLGRWEIQEATRNGRPTESLEELYFEFFQDGQMSTNLFGAPESSQYQIDGDLIQQRESRMETDYTIQEITDSTLTLATRMRDFDFQFRLRRSIQEE